MSDKAFFDTNILIYSITEAGIKTSQARTRLKGGGVISVQVLNEVVSVARRRLLYSWPDIEEAVLGIRELFPTPVPLTISTHESGLRISTRYGFRIYDSLVVASALEAGCRILYSEDLQDGQLIEGVLTVRNPFT
jgi:predicted nucleic acid-binding protein